MCIENIKEFDWFSKFFNRFFPKRGWKIVKVKGDTVFSFIALKGDRNNVISIVNHRSYGYKFDEWYEAETFPNIGFEYNKGFHIFETCEDALKYFTSWTGESHLVQDIEDDAIDYISWQNESLETNEDLLCLVEVEYKNQTKKGVEAATPKLPEVRLPTILTDKIKYLSHSCYKLPRKPSPYQTPPSNMPNQTALT